MKILKTAYDTLLNTTPPLPPETGGIVGGHDRIITEVYFDTGTYRLNPPSIYVPNIILLNEIIEDWNKAGISFYGIFHSHYSRDRELSTGDKRYIMEIMRVMPPQINRLYFPIILPGKTVLGYQASRWNSEIHIACDKIEIF